MPTYRKHIAAGQICGDCVNGAIKGAVWSELGARKPVYNSYGCPDTNADGMFKFCKEQGMDWGAINSLPDEPGIAVRFSGHVGIYVGNGEVVEWRGFAYGCVLTKLALRKWTHWYRLPWVEYVNGDASEGAEVRDIGTLGSRLLKNGKKGEDVRVLQQILMELQYKLEKYGDDGEYGSETEKAVKEFQKDNSLEVDGEYGKKTHAALMEILAEMDEEEDDEEAASGKKVEITGGSVYAREGAGTQYKIITVVRKGQVFDHISTAANGWNAILLDGQTAWISGKYSVVK